MFSLHSKILFLSLFMFMYMYFFMCSTTLAYDSSLVGYSPEHLTSMQKLHELFETWTSKHNKNYKTMGEKLHRVQIFKDNLMYIDQRNKEVSGYWLGLNKFADMSHEEFKNTYLGHNPKFPKRKLSTSGNFSHKDVKVVPESVDWRLKGAVTEVKNQSQCGMYYNFIYRVMLSYNCIYTYIVYIPLIYF